MYLIRLILFCFFYMSTLGVAAEPIVIRDIRVEGIQRIEAGTVFSYLPVKVGELINDEKTAQIIRALFATGFFKDVSVEVDSGVIVVTVEERPSISGVDFIGAKEFDKDQLIKGMRQVGLADGRIFDRSLLDKAEQELKRQYLSRGRYAVSIVTTVTPLERNRISINFTIDEGEVAKIRQLNIIGSKAFKESELLDLFILRTPGMMTWWSKHDQYSRPKLTADLEVLKSFYLDKGYLEFNVDSTQVSISPDKKDMFINISISEGDKFSVSDVKVAGELLIPENEIRNFITIKPGEIFSRTKLAESTKKISDRLGNDGYAFANVNAYPEIDKNNNLVAFTFFIDPGRKVYVRRINLTGNTKTRDEVIRRELRQLEGAWYSADKISLSRSRVDRLGYFTEVNVETPAVQGATDQVDLNLAVVEKPTGNIMAGAGYGTGQGLMLSGSISQQNIFGSGRHVSAQINTSQINTVYSLSYTNPYFTEDGVSQGFDVYSRKVSPAKYSSAYSHYETVTNGLNARFGIPIAERDMITYGLGYESTAITVYSDSPLFYTNYVSTFGNNNDAIVLSGGWMRDDRDSLIYPTRGAMQRVTSEVSLPGGSLRYYKAGYQYQQYIPLSRIYTLMLNADLGYGDGLNGLPLPFFKNYFAGGVSSVRGYRQATLGPKDTIGNPKGASHKALANAEFLFPFPGLQNDKSVRLGAFVDSGLISDGYSFEDFRYSTGLSLTWTSPMGPLKISLGKALNAQALDHKQFFQFTFGGVF